jgi:hypothetical protein
MTRVWFSIFTLSLVILPFLGQKALAFPTIEEIQKTAIEIPTSTSSVPNSVVVKMTEKKVIILGEFHGTQETPGDFFKITQALSSRHHSILIGLEIEDWVQPDVDHFMESGDLDALRKSPFFNMSPSIQDGRESSAMAELLTNLRSLKNVSVYCFNPSNNQGDHNLRMATNLLQRIENAAPDLTLILTGRCHAKLSQIGCGQDAPMGYQLIQSSSGKFTLQNVMAIDLRFGAGAAWGNDLQSVGIHTLEPDPLMYSQAERWLSYFYLENQLTEDGFNAALFERTVSASLPFVSSL